MLMVQSIDVVSLYGSGSCVVVLVIVILLAFIFKYIQLASGK